MLIYCYDRDHLEVSKIVWMNTNLFIQHLHHRQRKCHTTNLVFCRWFATPELETCSVLPPASPPGPAYQRVGSTSPRHMPTLAMNKEDVSSLSVSNWRTIILDSLRNLHSQTVNVHHSPQSQYQKSRALRLFISAACQWIVDLHQVIEATFLASAASAASVACPPLLFFACSVTQWRPKSHRPNFGRHLCGAHLT